MQPYAYQPEQWRDLYVMLGTSAAALIGLLFVATSLHLDDVVRNPVYHTRAYNQTRYLVLLLSKRCSCSCRSRPWHSSASRSAAQRSLGLSLPLSNIYSFVYKNKAGGRAGRLGLSAWVLRYVGRSSPSAWSVAPLIAAGLGWGIYLSFTARPRAAGPVAVIRQCLVDHAGRGVGRKA